jgi:uncharacterized protein (TIGR03437 family)
MKTAMLLLLFAGAAFAQGTAPLPLHVSPTGLIEDSNGKPVPLRGLNRSATASGNADANATDQEYGAQNQLLSMNLVRIFVNATWWNQNVNVPIANLGYQAYIDLLIQRVKKNNNYVLILKASNFPDAPCGASGQNCPAPNQGDLNCAANAGLCASQDTTGNAIDGPFTFWAAFARKYAGDPSILYDTWEDMHGIDVNTWSNGQNELIAAIRTYSPQALIFVEDTGTAFEQIAAGTLPDLAWSNIVWNFHLYAGPSGSCTQTASPRYANWPQNFDPLVSYAQQHGHGAGIMEWGGCNDSEPYHTNITSYARTHSVALAYFDNSYLLTSNGGAFALTATGTKVGQAYAALASGGPAAVTSVSSANGATTLAPEAIAEAFGGNLATQSLPAASVPLPTNLGGTTVAVVDSSGISRAAELFYVSAGQVNYQVPPGVATGSASVTVSLNGNPVGSGTMQIAPVSPGLYTATADGKGIAAGIALTVHADGSSGYAYTFQCAAAGNCTPIPIDLGASTDTVALELFGTGIRGHSKSVTCQVGSATLPVAYAGPQGVYVGLDQVNVILPQSLRGTGQAIVVLTVDGQTANSVSVTFK